MFYSEWSAITWQKSIRLARDYDCSNDTWASYAIPDMHVSVGGRGVDLFINIKLTSMCTC